MKIETKFKKYIISLGVLLMAMVATTACSSGDTIIDEPINEPIVKPEAPKTYTMTVQATMGGDAATTRALGFDGTNLIATWTKDDVVKVYRVDGGSETNAPVGTLTAHGSGKTTTLTGTFTDYTPTVGNILRLKYLTQIYSDQKGTLEYIAANCDYATADVTITDVTDGKVATTDASFKNQQAIVKFSLKKSDGTTPIAAKNFSVKYGSNTYFVNLDNASSDIYVAIPGQSSNTVKLGAYSSAEDKIFGYGKASVIFENGKYYTISVKMSEWSGDLEMLPIDYTAKNNDLLTGKLDGKLKLSIAKYAHVYLYNVTINAKNSAGITCLGNAEIYLLGTNNVKTKAQNYPAVQVADDVHCTLTIYGDGGSLTATGGDSAAGIGSGSEGHCDHIIIRGNCTVTATGGQYAAGIGSGYKGSCKDISISSGCTVTAKGGQYAAGIGSGNGGSCDNITITTGVTKVTATKGDGASYSIGMGISGSCGNIIIGDTGYDDGITTSPFTYQPTN